MKEGAFQPNMSPKNRLIFLKFSELLPEDQQNYVQLTEDGYLEIVSGHEFSDWVLALQERLRRQRIAFKRKIVPAISSISPSRGNNVGATEKTQHSSIRQDEVLDILKAAVDARASDLHIVIDKALTQIKLRVDGQLTPLMELSSQLGNDLCATIYQTMCDVAEPLFNPRRSQDARLMIESIKALNLYGGRVATRPTDSGLLMVIRLLYGHGDVVSSLDKLGYLTAQAALLSKLAEKRFGINILSGPTGSGKSTTLECVLKSIIEITGGKLHLLTIEDPPEYQIEGAVQTPILCEKDDDEAISAEWARAISNAMRLDPDILMCGEIRDLFSATATFRAAMTGHGVWTTLHANDSLAILSRLKDLGVSLELLTDPCLVTGLVNQVLVRVLCPECKVRCTEHFNVLTEQQKWRIEKFCDVDKVFLSGPGCQACGQKGIQGRTVVAEVVAPDIKLMELYVQAGKNIAKQYWIKEMGGLTKNAVLIQKINSGLVDPRDGESAVGMLDEDSLLMGKKE